MSDPLVVLLVTVGDPDQLSGAYIYHRRLADLAPQHDVRYGSVSVPDGPFPLPALAARRLVEAVLGEQPHAVVVDSLAASYLAPAIRRLAAVPLIGSVHQPPGGLDHGPLHARVQARLDLIVYRQAALLVAASEPLGEQLVASRLPRRRIRVIPPGRDVAPESATATADPPPDLRRGRAAAFLCVANWLPRKGLVALVDAFARLPSDVGTLHLVGRTDLDPAYQERLQARLQMPELRERVIVHGALPPEQVATLYAAADVFVLPSTQEPQGTVFGEAMAMGLPVVGVAAGNLPHRATDGVEGRIVPVGDTPALTQAMLELARDEALRQRLGAAALQRARARPTWEDTANEFFGALRAVVERRSVSV